MKKTILIMSRSSRIGGIYAECANNLKNNTVIILSQQKISTTPVTTLKLIQKSGKKQIFQCMI